MNALRYRIVTNWPASMKEDFVFASTEDRNAHYDLVVEVLTCIADEKDPASFRITEETIVEYDVRMPKEPSVPYIPTLTGNAEDDLAFSELCRHLAFAGSQNPGAENFAARLVHVTNAETYTLDGEQLATLADLAKRNRAEAKFRFILGKYGLSEGAIRRLSLERQTESAPARFSLDSLGKPSLLSEKPFGKGGKKPKKDKKPKDGKKPKKGKGDKKPKDGKKPKKGKKK